MSRINSREYESRGDTATRVGSRAVVSQNELRGSPPSSFRREVDEDETILRPRSSPTSTRRTPSPTTRRSPSPPSTSRRYSKFGTKSSEDVSDSIREVENFNNGVENLKDEIMKTNQEIENRSRELQNSLIGTTSNKIIEDKKKSLIKSVEKMESLSKKFSPSTSSRKMLDDDVNNLNKSLKKLSYDSNESPNKVISEIGEINRNSRILATDTVRVINQKEDDINDEEVEFVTSRRGSLSQIDKDIEDFSRPRDGSVYKSKLVSKMNGSPKLEKSQFAKSLEDFERNEESRTQRILPSKKSLTSRKVNLSVPEGELLNNTLLSKGYTVIKSIVVDGKMPYVVAYNIAGDLVLIKTEEGKYAMDAATSLVGEQVTGTQIERSWKTTVETCADSTTCGAGFMCNGAMCIMENVKEGSQEINISFKSDANDMYIEGTNYSTPIPLVLMSDINTKNNEVISSVRDLTCKLERKTAEKLMSDTKAVTSKLDEFITTSKNMPDLYRDYHFFLDKETKQYLKILDKFESLSESDKELVANQEKKKATVDRLYNLTNVRNELLVMMKNFSKFNIELNKQTDRLRTMKMKLFTSAVDNLDTDVEGVPKFLKASNWDLPSQIDNLTDKDIISGNFGASLSNEKSQNFLALSRVTSKTV